jgi:hypothetical protein
MRTAFSQAYCDIRVAAGALAFGTLDVGTIGAIDPAGAKPSMACIFGLVGVEEPCLTWLASRQRWLWHLILQIPLTQP